MTFSGLPSIRDPKHSIKNTGCTSPTSTSSSSTASSPTSPVSKPVRSDLQHAGQAPVSSSAAIDSFPRSNSPAPNPITDTRIDFGAVEGGVKGVINITDDTGSSSNTGNASSIPFKRASLTTPLRNGSFENLAKAGLSNTATSLDNPSAHPHATMSAIISAAESGPHTPPASSPLLLNVQTDYRQIQPPLPPIAASPLTPSSLSSSSLSKKKGVPQNLSPAHSAAYRKRLNVNQVCDWCRYRKIRCDRESPCNSCQHSKRECIRTPTSVLLNKSNNSNSNNDNSNDTTNDGNIMNTKLPVPAAPMTILNTKMKRSRTDAQSSPRACKTYRGSSISSHHSSSYTSFSSDQDRDQDQDDDDSTSIRSGSTRAGDSSVSPVVGSLTLAELGLGGLVGTLNSARRGEGNELLQFEAPAISNSTASFTAGMVAQETPLLDGADLSVSLPPSSSSSAMDQDSLERMRRIELLLSNVIPGAAEFIAYGTNRPQFTHHRQSRTISLSREGSRADGVEKQSLWVNTQGLEKQQHRDIIMSPQDRLASISLSSPAISTFRPRFNSLAGLSSLQEENKNALDPHPAALDYAERMKRIELLLGTVQDLPLAVALMGHSSSEHVQASQAQAQGLPNISSSAASTSADVSDGGKSQKKLPKKKQGKGSDIKKSTIINSQGQVVKRPHVAAGFAGQKPPPKLPQAIAEAAQKKQSARKKRNSARQASSAAPISVSNTGANTDTSTDDKSSTIASAGASSNVSPGAANEVSTVTDIAVSRPALTSRSQAAQDQGKGRVNMEFDSRMVAISPTASLEIPSTIENVTSMTFDPQQALMMIPTQHARQQAQTMLHHRGSVSYQQQQPQSYRPFQQYYQQQQQQRHQQSAISTVGSMTIPLDTIGSYGSLVVPASSSPCSSATSSPRIARAEPVSVSEHEASVQGTMNMILSTGNMVSPFSGSQLQHSHQSLQQQGQEQISSFGQMNQFQMDFGFASTPASSRDAQMQSFIQQQQSQTGHFSPDASFDDFGLNMNESLESLMKKDIDGLMNGLAHDSTASLLQEHQRHHQHHRHQHQQQQQQYPVSTAFTSPSIYNTSAVNRFGFSQQQQRQTPQQIQEQHGQLNYRDVSRSMWIPSHTGSLAVPASSISSDQSNNGGNDEDAWCQSRQQQQQIPKQSSQSIIISANGSPQDGMDLDLEIEGSPTGAEEQQTETQAQQPQQQQQQQQHLQQQQQRSAHALFQQQHQQQQQRHMDQLQQQQQQVRKSSCVVGLQQQYPLAHTLQQHRSSIQHQHQQTFYIPQMQDDDDENGFDTLYEGNSTASSNEVQHDTSVPSGPATDA
ncbi:hypothetical protein EDD11_002731 [Mortierella claussenii]|nr:hypothetical protein EDD11_002731 [Mortierella claussenii]